MCGSVCVCWSQSARTNVVKKASHLSFIIELWEIKTNPSSVILVHRLRPIHGHTKKNIDASQC